MTREDRMDALHTDIYAEIGYHLGIDDSDDGACDAKNRVALGVLRLIERDMADAEDLSAKIEGAWEWIARVEPHPELNGGLLSGLRAALSGRPNRCDRCHRPLPHSEAESRVCVPDVPAARDDEVEQRFLAARREANERYDALGDEPEPEQCPTPCDDDCDAGCHEAHEVPVKRDHDPASCPGVQVTTPEATPQSVLGVTDEDVNEANAELKATFERIREAERRAK